MSLEMEATETTREQIKRHRRLLFGMSHAQQTYARGTAFHRHARRIAN
jgi:hypothetical protein